MHDEKEVGWNQVLGVKNRGAKEYDHQKGAEKDPDVTKEDIQYRCQQTAAIGEYDLKGKYDQQPSDIYSKGIFKKEQKSDKGDGCDNLVQKTGQGHI